jgi:hypothetical protein
MSEKFKLLFILRIIYIKLSCPCAHCNGIWGSGGIASLILSLGSRWRWMVNFIPWLHNPLGKSTQNQLNWETSVRIYIKFNMNGSEYLLSQHEFACLWIVCYIYCNNKWWWWGSITVWATCMGLISRRISASIHETLWCAGWQAFQAFHLIRADEMLGMLSSWMWFWIDSHIQGSC